MPSKKKTAKKSKVKKQANKKPQVKTSVAAPAKPAAEPVAAAAKPRWDIWVLASVVGVVFVFLAINMVSRPNNEAVSDQASQNSDSSSSELRVVPGREGGTSSPEASGTLQPQPTGLQQAQPTTQSANGLNLQAQTTPNQTTIR